jgi:cold shock CspA family protein
MWHFRELMADLTGLSGSRPPKMPADHEPASPRVPVRRGTVLWFDQDKGHGRIGCAGGGTVTVHQSTVEQSGMIGLFPGQEVEFDLVPWGGYHVRADNLRLIAACAE